MDLATAKSKIVNYRTADHTKLSITALSVGEIAPAPANDDVMEAVLKLLKDIESRVTALEQ